MPALDHATVLGHRILAKPAHKAKREGYHTGSILGGEDHPPVDGALYLGVIMRG